MKKDEMQSKVDRMVDFLLKNANSSIVYHVKNDILHNITDKEKEEIQERIMQEEIIQTIVKCQKENGWLGNGFHGPNKNAGQYENQEVGVKYLGEKFAIKSQPVLKRAIDAFGTMEISAVEEKFAAGNSRTIVAACIARADYEDEVDITDEINEALLSFKRVTEVESVLDIVTIRKKRPEKVNPLGITYVFNAYEKWPCRYHLDILAHTDSWKTKENVIMIADSFNRLLDDKKKLDYKPAYCVNAGHLVGCCGALYEGMDIFYENEGKHYVVLDMVEYMCRCGLYNYVPELKNEVDLIMDSIDENGICRVDFLETAIKGMGTYSGGQLEVDWKSKTRKLCDVTYRALLIAYYAFIN